jgi:hypothetical protein
MFVPRSALEVGALCFLSMFSLHLCSSAGDPQFHLPLYALFDSEVSILYQNVSIALLHTSLAVGHRKRPYFKGVILEFEVIFRIRYWNLEYGRNLLCFVKKQKKSTCLRDRSEICLRRPNRSSRQAHPVPRTPATSAFASSMHAERRSGTWRKTY